MYNSGKIEKENHPYGTAFSFNRYFFSFLSFRGSRSYEIIFSLFGRPRYIIYYTLNNSTAERFDYLPGTRATVHPGIRLPRAADRPRKSLWARRF